jgi:hypothetical protein
MVTHPDIMAASFLYMSQIVRQYFAIVWAVVAEVCILLLWYNEWHKNLCLCCTHWVYVAINY